PFGAWTILWKEWLTTRRVAGGLRMPAIVLMLAVILGAGIGAMTRSGVQAAAFLLGPLAYAAVFFSLFTAYRLSGDLRKPIWWLSASSLRTRLAVLLIARSLRIAIPITAGLLTASLAGGSVAFVYVGAPIAVAALWAINAMGVATYAIIPGSSDMRGPGGCLRVVALFIMVIPIGIAAIVGGIAAQSGVGSLVAALVTALAEGWLLIVFAASQLEDDQVGLAGAGQLDAGRALVGRQHLDAEGFEHRLDQPGVSRVVVDDEHAGRHLVRPPPVGEQVVLRHHLDHLLPAEGLPQEIDLTHAEAQLLRVVLHHQHHRDVPGPRLTEEVVDQPLRSFRRQVGVDHDGERLQVDRHLQAVVGIAGEFHPIAGADQERLDALAHGRVLGCHQDGRCPRRRNHNVVVSGLRRRAVDVEGPHQAVHVIDQFGAAGLDVLEELLALGSGCAVAAL